MKLLFGDYYKEPRPEIFSTTTNANAASPDVLKLCGRRAVAVPETEKGVKQKTAFMKTIRDQSSDITARGLFKGNKAISRLFQVQGGRGSPDHSANPMQNLSDSISEGSKVVFLTTCLGRSNK